MFTNIWNHTVTNLQKKLLWNTNVPGHVVLMRQERHRGTVFTSTSLPLVMVVHGNHTNTATRDSINLRSDCGGADCQAKHMMSPQRRSSDRKRRDQPTVHIQLRNTLASPSLLRPSDPPDSTSTFIVGEQRLSESK